MTEALRVLWALQHEDDQLGELEQALSCIPGELHTLEARMLADRRGVEEHQQRLKQLQLDRRGLEREGEVFSDQEKKFQSQLFLVKTNQEYQALLHEIEAAKQKRSAVETRLLEGFEEEERFHAARTALEAAAADSQRRADARRAELEAEQARLGAQAAVVRARRNALLEQLPAATRGRYERIHAALGGRAVVPVVRNACGGCGRQLPPQRVQEARRQESAVLCDGCGRMVIWPPEAT